MKRIWLVNQYAMPPQLESRLRTIKFAHYLTQKGYDVTIFASSVMHNMGINLIEDGSLFVERQYGNIKFVHINTRMYRSNGIDRIISSTQFPLRLCRIASKFPPPDVIVQSATVPFGNMLYYMAKRLRARYIVEVVDLWPESLADLGMMSRRNPLMWLLYRAERWQYARADRLVFSMEGGAQYLKDKRWDSESGGPIDLSRVFYINNGVDLNDFNSYLRTYRLDDPDLTNPEVKRVIYLGSIRRANHVKHLVEAAEVLQTYPGVKFLIYGDGDERESLVQYCRDRQLSNVLFKEKWIDPCYVPYVLSCADVNMLNYMQGDFAKYGGSQSKLFQYMASGKPICCNLEMMYSPIKRYDLGIEANFASPEEYAQAIYRLAHLPREEYDAICQRNMQVVKDFDYIALTNKLEDLF